MPWIPIAGVGGGQEIPEWGTGIFLVDGVPGERVNCTVDGEPAIAVFNGVAWGLVSPSDAANAYISLNPMPPGQTWFKDYAILSPGGLNYFQSSSEDEAFTIPLHLYAGIGITSIELGGWNTQGVSWTIKRAYIGQRDTAGGITENISTGFKTIVAAPVAVSNLGSRTAPARTSVGEVNVAGLVGDFELVIEVASGAEKRVWGNNGASVGYGAALSGTNWTAQKLATLPSTLFVPHTYSGFSASQMPNVYVVCKGLSEPVVQPLIVGDSIAQGFGSVDSFGGKSGLAYEWFTQWEANDLHYIPLQLGWEGSSSQQISAMLATFYADLGPMPTFLQGATINNWNETFGYLDPSARNITDLEANIALLGSVPYRVWLGFGWDALDATKRGQIRSCHNIIEATYGNGLYGNETCNVMDPVTMLYLAGKTLDGGHPNQSGWTPFAASNYVAATAFLGDLSSSNHNTTIPVYSTYNDLPTGVEGDEAFFTKVQTSNSTVRKLYAKRGPVKWDPGYTATDLTYIAANPRPAPAVLPLLADYTYIAPGGMMSRGSDSGNEAWNVAVKPGGINNTWTSVDIGFSNDKASTYDVARVYVGPPSANTITENFATGFVTVISSPVTIAAGSATNNTVTWVAVDVPTAGASQWMQICVELASGARTITWSDGYQTIGWDQTLLGREPKLTVLPSSGTFNVTSTSAAFSVFPGLVVKFKGLGTYIATILFAGDSHVAAYGDGGGINTRQGLGYRLSEAMKAASTPATILQLGYDGQSTTAIKTRLANYIAGPFSDIRAGMLQSFSINNFTQSVTAAQARIDFADMVLAFDGQPTVPVLLGVSNNATAPQWADQQGEWEYAEATYPYTLNGVKTNCVNYATGQWNATYFFGDGAHFNTLGYNALSTDNFGKLLAWLGNNGVATVPSLLKISVVTGGQDFQNPMNNDGSLWFHSGGGVGTFVSEVTNLETDSIVEVEVLQEGVGATNASSPGFGIQSNDVWSNNTTVVTPGAGSYFAPSMVVANVVLSQPWVGGSAASFHHMLDTGLWTAAKTFSNTYWTTSLQVNNVGFYSGNHINDIPGGGIGIGPFPSRITCKLAPAALSRAIVEMFGDSTVAEVRPLADSDGNSKEGIWFRANEYARANAIRTRIYSRANGALDFNQIYQRIDANIPNLVGRCTHAGVPLWTWNSGIDNMGQVNTQWNAWLQREAAIRAVGLIPFPFILHPPTTRNSTGQLEAHAELVARVLAHSHGIYYGGIFADVNGIDLPAAWSQDNVHLNGVGASATGTAVMNMTRTMVQIDYPEL